MSVFAKTEKFLNLAFKIDKIKTKYKFDSMFIRKVSVFLNATFHAQTVVLHYDKPLTNDKIL